jgi:hypothetical protein
VRAKSTFAAVREPFSNKGLGVCERYGRISSDTGVRVAAHKWHSGGRVFDPRQLHQ